MSADEDTELRDLVAQTLESNGTLGKLRAQLRASVFLALVDQEKNGQNNAPYLNKELRGFLSTPEGKMTASLVQEFLEFFNLEYTQAVFKPETGVSETDTRSELLKQLKLPSFSGSSSTPLLTSLLQGQGSGDKVNPGIGSGDGVYLAKAESRRDLTDKQVEEARKKFDFYDKDKSGAIDKSELRDLFMDMFPSFHRNMLDRYVNDEFNAVDKDFSSSIDFDEFLGMYKRLFLCCRSVVAGDVEDIVAPSHDSKKSAGGETGRLSSSDKSDPLPSDKSESKPNSAPLKAAAAVKDDGSDIEEDPFFDDVPAASVNFNTLSSELEKGKDSAQSHDNKPAAKENGSQQQTANKGKSSGGSGLSSLDGLPSLTGAGGGGWGSDMGSLAGMPPLGGVSKPTVDESINDSDLDKNLRAIDKRMVDLGLDSQNDDYEYEDDFSPEHSLSQKSPRASKGDSKAENGSIAEEIDDEEIDDISIEADDLLRSEKSGFDDLTTDHSISQADGGFDYMEDPVLP